VFVFPLLLSVLLSSVDRPLSRSCSRGGGGGGGGGGRAVLDEAADGGREEPPPGVRGVEVEDEVDGEGGVVQTERKEAWLGVASVAIRLEDEGANARFHRKLYRQ
jgi:hypothetical protein